MKLLACDVNGGLATIGGLDTDLERFEVGAWRGP